MAKTKPDVVAKAKPDVLDKESLAGIEWATDEAVAKRLNRSKRRVHEFANEKDAEGKPIIRTTFGEVPGSKKPRRLFSGVDVERFLEQRRRKQPQPRQARGSGLVEALVQETRELTVGGVGASTFQPQGLAALLAQLLQPPRASQLAPSDPYFNLTEASEYLRVTRRLLLELILAKRLPAFKDHVKADPWRVRKSALDALDLTQPWPAAAEPPKSMASGGE
jgi:hypothetical protein